MARPNLFSAGMALVVIFRMSFFYVMIVTFRLRRVQILCILRGDMWLILTSYLFMTLVELGQPASRHTQVCVYFLLRCYLN